MDRSKIAKRSWNIGKLGEAKTKKLLKDEGYIIYKTDVDSAGIDLMTFKNNMIKLIEVKATDKNEYTWKQIFPKKQYNKYKKLQKDFEKENFNVELFLYVWKKKKNRWVVDILNLTNEKFR